MNVTISIGRNVGKVPLPTREWDSFVGAIDFLVSALVDQSQSTVAQVVQFGYVDGYWNGDREDSYTITVADVDPTLERNLANCLRVECIRYSQDSIAATWYEPTLIERTLVKR